jgi:hypothetical protein
MHNNVHPLISEENTTLYKTMIYPNKVAIYPKSFVFYPK